MSHCPSSGSEADCAPVGSFEGWFDAAGGCGALASGWCVQEAV
jgi:hypothetical protein